MSNARIPAPPPDADTAAQQFFVVQELLNSPELARIYTELLINEPTTIPAVRDRQNVSKSTAYKYANALEELGIAEELDAYEDGSSLWRAAPVNGVWRNETAVELGPVIIAVFGATSVDDDLALFVERHGKAALAPAISATIAYLAGETTRRGIADTLAVPEVEAIAVSQAIERIIVVVKEFDPALSERTFEVDVHARAIENGPYQRAHE